MEVLVIGAGSLGSLVGGLLAREHDVTLVGREPHVDAVRADGLAIEGELRDRVSPAATTDPEDCSADLAVVAVKADDTESAATTLAGCDVGAVWSLQNGLGNESTLARALGKVAAGTAAPGATVLAGTATYGAEQTAPGAVTCTGLGGLAIGPRPGAETPESDAALAEELANELDRGRSGGQSSRQSSGRFGGQPGEQSGGRSSDGDAGGLAVVSEPAMPERLWRKLAVNAGINPVTALARIENGALADGDASDLARRAARETARVASATGVDLDEEETVAELEAVVEATADNRSSMLQDVTAGRRTEIDAISGAVVDRGDEHGVPVPTNRTLATLVRQWERGQQLR